MKKISVKGEVLYNEAGGQVKVLSQNGRLSFPCHVIDTTSSVRRRINSHRDLLAAVQDIKRRKRIEAITKRMVIEERINAHVRSVHGDD